VIHFEKNSSDLDAGDKRKIQDLLGHYEIDERSRIVVIGYTDNSGDKAYNYTLSRRRARNVQRIVHETLRLRPGQIIEIGKGPENPETRNSSKAGQAGNRRVEVYLLNASENSETQSKRNPDQPAQPKPDPAAVESLVREAGDLLRHRKLDEALYKLQQGRALGGDQSADWHAAYGIAGFYAGVDPQIVQAHLNMALRLDPFHYEARDFSGRLDARLKVADGRINAAMGRSPDAPIAVSAKAQEYEFLSLFQVQSVAHYQLGARPVDVWECLDRQNRPVVYYFDYSAIHAKLFDPIASIANRSPDAPEDSLSNARPAPPLMDSQKVWESKLFR
jgi:hypothetical protein